MRLDVTPLGGAGRTVAQVAGAIVEYLEGGVGDPGGGLLVAPVGGSRGEGLESYLGDSAEGPGRWIGQGAAAHGLAGAVERGALARVLEGRHPHSGARLLTARGSSQRAHLATGTAARFDELGYPLYTKADTARLLGLSGAEIDAMIDDGGLRTVTVDGDTFVPDAEVTRLLEAIAGPAVERVNAGGDADDWLSGPQAARLLGVSAQYVRRLCGRSEDGIEVDGVAQLASERVAGTGAFRIRRGDLAEFAATRKPPVARVGYDVTLTTEKSFAVVMMLADGERQRRFVDALRTANDTAIDHLDRHAALARRCGEVVSTHGLIGAIYFHGTSRALDPHPHHHNVIANAVVDDLGGVRALDARALYSHAPTAAALATAAARWELRDLGLGWWQRPDGIWEIAGVGDAAIDEFSSRHRDIREVRDAVETQLGRQVSGHEERRIWSDTRDDKAAVDPAELRSQWRQRAERVGFDVDVCFHRADAAIAVDRLDDTLTARLHADLLDPHHGLCSQTDRFARSDVVRAVADWSIGDDEGQRRKVLLPPAEVERLADDFLTRRQVIALSAALSRGVIRRRNGTIVDSGRPVRTYTTAEVIWTQHQTLNSWQAGRGGGHGLVDAALIDSALGGDGEVELSVEQRHLVTAWCTSGDRVQGAAGRAGAGKTTATRAAARAWESAGYRVIGAAVKGEAARQLGADADIEADTLALLLARLRRHEKVLDARTVLIVDEGSTIGDRELLELIHECERAGTTLRIIGDPAQHQAVTAGGCWSWLVNDAATPELRTVHRLGDAGERRRAEAIRSGRPGEVLAELEAVGQLVWSDNDHDTYAAMLQRWYESRRDGATHPMVHGRNRERRLLNDVAQQVLIADGSVDPTHSVTLSDGRRLCLGDEVIARHGDRRIHPEGNPAGWMRNGTTGHITSIAGDPQAGGDDVIVTITTAVGDELHLGWRTLQDRRGGIDLAYAVTSYAVQGSTRQRSTSAITAATSKAELYVDITRGRQSNFVYGTRTIPANLAETDHHLPAVEQDLASELATRLARPDGLPVVIADRHLADLARTGGMSLAKLHAEQRAGAAGPWDEAIERREATLRAATTVPAHFAAVLPPIPAVPHLDARYRRLAGDVTVWADTHNQPRPRTLTAMEIAIGARPTSNRAAASEWDVLANRARRLAVDVTRHHLDGRRPELRPLTADPDSWLRRWLDDLAGNGRLANLDVDQLLGVIDDAATHPRRRRGLPGITAMATSTATHRHVPLRGRQLVIAASNVGDLDQGIG